MKFSWLKLSVDFFDDHKIKRLFRLPGGAEIILCWIGVLTMAMRSTKKGYLVIGENSKANAEDLAIHVGVTVETATMALKAFESSGMISVTEDGAILVVNFSKHQDLHKIEFVTEAARLRKKRQREREKQALIELKGHSTVTCDNSVTVGTKIKIENKTKEIQEDAVISSPKASSPQQEGLAPHPAILYWLKAFKESTGADGIPDERTLLKAYQLVGGNQKTWERFVDYYHADAFWAKQGLPQHRLAHPDLINKFKSVPIPGHRDEKQLRHHWQGDLDVIDQLVKCGRVEDARRMWDNGKYDDAAKQFGFGVRP